MKNLKILSQVDYRVLDESESVLQLIRRSEASMTWTKFCFDVFYFRNGQYSLQQAYQNGNNLDDITVFFLTLTYI